MFKTTGFTLIEVLVAMVVLSGGLLGLAALQATTLASNQIAYNHSQATQLTYDMADRMRVNVADAKLLANSTYIRIMPNVAISQNDCMVVSLTCTAADMAQNDLFQWNEAIKASLPGCANANPPFCGRIELNGSAFSIILNWDDNRDGDIDGDGGADKGDIDGDGDSDDDPVFQVNFQL